MLATRASSTSGCTRRRRMSSAPPYPLPPMIAALNRLFAMAGDYIPPTDACACPDQLAGWQGAAAEEGAGAADEADDHRRHHAAVRDARLRRHVARSDRQGGEHQQELH